MFYFAIFKSKYVAKLYKFFNVSNWTINTIIYFYNTRIVLLLNQYIWLKNIL